MISNIEKERTEEEKFINNYMNKIITKYTSLELEIAKLNDELNQKEYKNYFYKDMSKLKEKFNFAFPHTDQLFNILLRKYQYENLIEKVDNDFINVLTNLNNLLIFDAKIYDYARYNLINYNLKDIELNIINNRNINKKSYNIFYHELFNIFRLNLFTFKEQQIKLESSYSNLYYLNKMVHGLSLIKDIFNYSIEEMSKFLSFIENRINTDLYNKICDEDKYLVIFEQISDEIDNDTYINYDLKKIIKHIRKYIFKNINENINDIISDLQISLTCNGSVTVDDESYIIDESLTKDNIVDILITLAISDILEAIMIDIDDMTEGNEYEHAMIYSKLLIYHLNKHIL